MFYEGCVVCKSANRKSTKCTSKITLEQLIKGTDCHLQHYVHKQIRRTEGGLSSFHLQCKTYKRMNQYEDLSKSLSDPRDPSHQVQDLNPWVMETDDSY